MSNQQTFPLCIRRGSVVVKIYRGLTHGQSSFTVIYYDANRQRQRKAFANLSSAKTEAHNIAEQLARGQTAEMVMQDRDRHTYQRALEILRPTGLPLDTAAHKLADAIRQLNGADLGEAIRFYLAHNQREITHKPVPLIVEEMVQTKMEKGRSILHVKDLRLRLTQFAKAFRCPLESVVPSDIECFLKSLKAAPRTKNNFRRHIGSLFRFAQAKGYVSKAHSGVTDIEKETEGVREIEVFTPGEIQVLLNRAKPELVPALAIGAFAGLRSEEIRRLDWQDIDFPQRHIVIKAAISKTKVRRLVSISANLVEWLSLYARPNGRVVAFSNYGNQLLKLASQTGIQWKRNGLRHSFISYQVALTKEVHKVAFEAGNSPAIISRNYLRCVTEAEALKWFAIKPPVSGNILPLLSLAAEEEASKTG